jgi:hypothetical protein
LFLLSNSPNYYKRPNRQREVPPHEHNWTNCETSQNTKYGLNMVSSQRFKACVELHTPGMK